jgi:hypothetical protein
VCPIGSSPSWRAKGRGIAACIPARAKRKAPIAHDAGLYRQRRKIEIMGRLKDWRRIHTRYNRCAHTFFSAICIAAIVIFWLRSMSAEPRSVFAVGFPEVRVGAVPRNVRKGVYGPACSCKPDPHDQRLMA